MLMGNLMFMIKKVFFFISLCNKDIEFFFFGEKKGCIVIFVLLMVMFCCIFVDFV